MKKIKLIIEIGEEEYENVLKFTDCYAFGYAIADGKPLQKKHGRLVDAEKLYNQIDKLNCGDDKGKYTGILSLIALTPTIIEADNGG